MCLVCGVPVLECVYCMVCMRWAWKRCLHSGEHDSERWGPAEIEDFEPVPRMCRIILAGYEEDLRNPKFAPQPHGYGMDPDCVVERVDYAQTHGRAPPYIVYVDKPRRDVVVAIRGLNMAVESDYALLWDNKLGQTTFDGGFVHNGLLKSAQWIFDRECSMLSELLNVENPGFSLTLAGHSLGSGIAALMALIAVNNRDRLGGVARSRIRCFSIAPARCMSLNLAVRYADVINSIILQDDFLPRTATPLEDIFKSVFCLPCLLCIRCLKDTCIPEESMLADPRRLYAPGRLYHIVERKVCRCGKLPPVVKTAVPVEGRFEHIVLSCNATSDHAIIWIERESQKALDLMIEKDKAMEMPTEQRMQRQQTLIREHDEEYRAAVERAETLKLPQADSASYGTFDSDDGSNHLQTSLLDDTGEKMAGTSEVGESSMKTRGQLRWKHLVGLFTGKHKSNYEPIDGSD